MRKKNDLTDIQNTAISRMYEENATLLVAPTGAGKTVCLLTAIQELIDNQHLSRVLIIAPLKVCMSAWSNECNKWHHLQSLSCGVAIDTPIKRTAIINNKLLNVIIINEENSKWLFNNNLHLDFDGLAIDETSKWTVSGGERFKALRHKVKHFKWRVGLTAQPVGENWVGLFGQVMLLDDGKRLGRNKQNYLEKYFYSTDYMQRKWSLMPCGAQQISEKIETLVHVMPDYKASLPTKNLIIEYIDLPESVKTVYKTFKRDSFMQLESNTVTAPNAGALAGKLEQIANGFSYTDDDDSASDRQTITHHTKKIEWVAKRVADLSHDKKSVIVVYWYQADLEKLKILFPGALTLTSVSKTQFDETLKKWQSKEGHKVMLMHPASGGHGVDGLQVSCHHQLWLAPCWSRDKWQQTQDRLWRQGQKNTVSIEVCVARNTIDEVKLQCVEWKGNFHELFIEHLGSL